MQLWFAPGAAKCSACRPPSRNAIVGVRVAAMAGGKGKRVPQRLTELMAPHVQSFDYFVEQGLRAAVDSLPPAFLYLQDVRAPRARAAIARSSRRAHRALRRHAYGRRRAG